jgi:hypothetical protein
MIRKNFRCALEGAVITNRQVLNQGKPITIVIHEFDDGAWKFFSKEEDMNSDEGSILVSLEEILMIDPTVAEIAHLPEGIIATRRFVGDDWKTVSSKSLPGVAGIKSETVSQ